MSMKENLAKAIREHGVKMSALNTGWGSLVVDEFGDIYSSSVQFPCGLLVKPDEYEAFTDEILVEGEE